MDRLLTRLAGFASHKPRQTLLIAALLCVPALLIALQLDISTSRTALTSAEAPHWKRYMAFAKTFGIPEDLVVVLKGKSAAQVHQAADRVYAGLQGKEQAQVGAIFYRIDLSIFESRAPLYLKPKTIKLVTAMLEEASIGALFEARHEPERLSALAAVLGELPGALTEDVPKDQSEKAAKATEGLQRLMAELHTFAKNGGGEKLTVLDRKAALKEALGAGGRAGIDTDGYLTTDGGRTGVMFVRPLYTQDEMKFVLPFVSAVRKACDDAVAEQPGLTCGLTGNPAASAEEQETIKNDTKLTTAVALVGVVLLFIMYFPTLRLLLLALAPVACGVLWTAAGIQLLFGQLNLMSSIFLVVLIGMGIDFSVHMASRFCELRERGLVPSAAAELAVNRAGRGVVTGAVTSAGAFFVIGFCGFKGIEELGFAAALGLILTLGASLTVFPALLTMYGPSQRKGGRNFPGVGALVRGVLRLRAVVIGGALLTSLGLAFVSTKTTFDFSLLNLLPAEAESAVLMNEIISNPDLSADAAVAIAPDLEAARTLEAKFAALPSVHRTMSAASFVPKGQPERLLQLKALRTTLAKRRAAARAAEPSAATHDEAMEALEASLEDLSELLFSAKLSASVNDLEAALESIGAVRELLEDEATAPKAKAGIDRFGALLGEVFVQLGKRLEKAVEQGPITVDVLPADLKGRFVSPDGQFAVYAVPKGSIWDREVLGGFLTEARGVAPGLTGFPETFYENTGQIRDGFMRASIYAAIAVLVLLMFDLRRPRWVLLAAMPVMLGALWMAGSMFVFNMSYNLANIIGLPLVIGVGIDNGVHLIHRYREEHDIEAATVRTGGAVVLSSLTTMVGFGSLGLATHRGYSSLGAILFLGVGACLTAAIVVLPAVLSFMPQSADQHQEPE